MRLLQAAATVLVASASACGPASYPASIAHPLLGQPLPDIRHRQTLDGKPFDSGQLAGRPVLIKFFAEFCKPCKDTLPAAEHVHQTHPDVLVVGIDEDESPEKAGSLVQRYSLTFPVVHDADNVLSGRFRVSTMPTTFVADAKGVIRWVGGDAQVEADLSRAVEAAR
jgi:thiol-disulfide isomerase/thioredoxin